MSENIIVEENDVVLVYTITDQDNAAIDLTGATINWSIKKSVEDTAAISKSTSNGISITDPTGGEFEVTINNSDTIDLAEDNEITSYFMEAVITDASNKVYTITNDDIEPDTLKIRPIYTEV